MTETKDIIIAAKCAPREDVLSSIKKAGYCGFVVSEAKASLQTHEEFKRLNDFFKMWNAAAGQLEKRCF